MENKLPPQTFIKPHMLGFLLKSMSISFSALENKQGFLLQGSQEAKSQSGT